MTLPKHIRHEVHTRESYELVGSGEELPRHLCIAWCGADASSTWFFQSLDHAALAGGPACGACVDAAIRALREAL